MNSRLEETRAMYETGFLEETDVDKLQIASSNIEKAEKIATLESQVLSLM